MRGPVTINGGPPPGPVGRPGPFRGPPPPKPGGGRPLGPVGPISSRQPMLVQRREAGYHSAPTSTLGPRPPGPQVARPPLQPPAQPVAQPRQHQSQSNGDATSSQSLSRMPTSYPSGFSKRFELLREEGLGEGAFALVRRVKRKDNGEILALKVMEKQPLEIRAMLDKVRGEMRTHTSLSHQNIVAMVESYETGGHLLMIMELCSGGNLRVHLCSLPDYRLSEPVGAAYFAQVADAIAYLHGRKIIHRDLKPENLLLTEGGVIKICDFGWCANLSDGKERTTKCGTLDYMAPEILHGQPHGEPVDRWGLGILLYEMLVGHSPFAGTTSQDQLVARVVAVDVAFPPWMSHDATSLVRAFLQRQPESRLRAAEAARHPWLLTYVQPKPQRPESAVEVFPSQPQLSQKDVPAESDSPRPPKPAPRGPVNPARRRPGPVVGPVGDQTTPVERGA